MLTTVGATGLGSVGVLGFSTKDSVRYTKAVPVDGGTLEVDWRETYNNDVLEDTRTGSRFTSEGAVISLNDVLPGDVGTVSFRLENVSDSTVEPALSLVMTETSENGRIEPEKQDGDESRDTGELQEFIHTELWYDQGLGGFEVFGGDNAVQDVGEDLIVEGAEGTLADVAPEVNNVSLGQLNPDQTVTVSFRWEFKDRQDVNVTQTDSVGFKFDLHTAITGGN
jgi:hypothetical protein